MLGTNRFAVDHTAIDRSHGDLSGNNKTFIGNDAYVSSLVDGSHKDSFIAERRMMMVGIICSSQISTSTQIYILIDRTSKTLRNNTIIQGRIWAQNTTRSCNVF